MITRLGMAPRRADMTTAGFLEHWRTSHADAAGQIPFLRRYAQLHPVLVDGVHAFGYPGFDACSELEFGSVEDMDAGFASETYQQAVRDDEEAFVDKRRFSMVLGHRERLSGERPDGGVRLLSFVRRHPAATPEELDATLLDAYAAVIADDPVVRGHELLRPMGAERPGRERDACDAVDYLDFPDGDTARSWAGSEAAVRAGLALAGSVFGVTRLLAHEHPVVG